MDVADNKHIEAVIAHWLRLTVPGYANCEGSFDHTLL
jgi:hypothetical protein